MNETQFTTDELYALRLACTWSNIYWKKKRDNLSSEDPTRDTHDRIAREYSALWDKVDEAITAQESSLATVND